MESERALEIIRKYADFYSGRDCRGMDDIGIDRMDVQQAMRTILRDAGKPETVMQCFRCKHFDFWDNCTLRVQGNCGKFEEK